MNNVMLTGKAVLAAVTTTVGIDSAYVLSSATGYPTKWATGNATYEGSASGVPELHVFYDWDGTSGARYTVDGTTPTTTVGHLVSKGAAGTSTELTLRGKAIIAAFQTIGTGNGIKISWYISVDDDRS